MSKRSSAETKRYVAIHNLGLFDLLFLPFLACLVAYLVIGFRPGFDSNWLPLPLVGLYACFFWGLAFAGIRAAYAALLLGLTLDIASGGPWGPWACVHVLMFALSIASKFLLKSTTEYGQWLVFALLSFVAISAYGLWAGLHNGIGPSGLYLFLLWIATALLYYPLGPWFGRRRVLAEILRHGNFR